MGGRRPSRVSDTAACGCWEYSPRISRRGSLEQQRVCRHPSAVRDADWIHGRNGWTAPLRTTLRGTAT